MNKKILIFDDEDLPENPYKKWETNYYNESYIVDIEPESSAFKEGQQSIISKVIVLEEKDKPDSEGWWIFRIKGRYLNACYPCYYNPNNDTVLEWRHETAKPFNKMPQGKWIKDPIPEMLEEKK
jgi:hypothetical protein